MRYRSHIDAAKLIRAAQKELAPNDPPVFLAFLLALGAGLRRIEIDRLEWAAFRWSEGVIRIQPTQYFDVKTEHSSGDVSVDPEFMTVFRGYAAQASSNFVIEAPNLPLPDATFENYRAQAVFERLASWLRKRGVTARKPIHELRKEFGSMVNREHGLSAASDQLRHAGIAITAAHYIDRPRKATSGIGPLLATKRKGRKIVQFNETVSPSSRRERKSVPTREGRSNRAKQQRPPTIPTMEKPRKTVPRYMYLTSPDHGRPALMNVYTEPAPTMKPKKIRVIA